MTCTDYERHILLDASGELPRGADAALRGHLAECAHCREFAADLGFLQQRRAQQPSAPEAVIRRVQTAAQHPGRRVRYQLFSLPVRSLMAAAASLLLAVGLWQVTRPTPPEGSPGDARLARIANVSALLAALTEAENGHTGESSPQDARSNLESLARQLLILQDMNVEMPEDLADNPTSPEASRPTSLRSHSIPSTPATECG